MWGQHQRTRLQGCRLTSKTLIPLEFSSFKALLCIHPECGYALWILCEAVTFVDCRLQLLIPGQKSGINQTLSLSPSISIPCLYWMNNNGFKERATSLPWGYPVYTVTLRKVKSLWFHQQKLWNEVMRKKKKKSKKLKSLSHNAVSFCVAGACVRV